MWTKEYRQRYDRDALRYPSDLTDDEWSRVADLIPPPSAAAAGARLSCGKSSTASCMC